LYYCVREPDEGHNDTQLLVHRGGRDGPVIATADPCAKGKYRTDIHFRELNMMVPLSHKHGAQHYCSVKNLFHHRGDKEQVENTDEVVAHFHASPFRGSREVLKLGNIDLGVKGIQDIVVVTALVAQEREEETHGPVNT
jgi:hypothetical protein